MNSIKKAALFLLLLAALVSFLYFQNFALQRETCSVFSSSLPRSFEGFRVLQLSDLHGRLFGTDSAGLLKAVRKSTPDIICLTGDLFDESTDLSMLPPLLEGLTAIAPTFYVTGNHEWQVEGLGEILKQMEDLGVTVLENEYVLLEKDDERIVIAGVHDPCGPYDQKTPHELMAEIRQEVGEEAYVLMLAHRNDTIDLWAELGADLVLTGHCHGGVVRLPFVGGVFGTGRELFPEYDAGLYEKDGTFLYVSRGLGYSNIPFRLFNRPHLPILVLKT